MYTCTNMYNLLCYLVSIMWFKRGCLCFLYWFKYYVNIYPKKEKDEKADAITVSFVLDYNIHESENEIETNAPIKTSD